MPIVLEGALSASLYALRVKISSATKPDAELLKNLDVTLMTLQSLLHDAEEKQITVPAVKEWLNILHGLVYEADDLFDEINTGEFRNKVEADQVLQNFSSFFKRFNRDINSKLRNLFEKLQHLRNQKLGLRVADYNHDWNVTPTSSLLVDESVIYGRDDEIKKLKELLLSEDGGDSGSKIGVISIVGMAGLGKTTIAKLLYNDHDVRQKFMVCGWAHISPDLDIFTVTKIILESLTSKRNETDDLKILQMQLQQTLWAKKFLLVLDDISSARYVDWTILNDIFNVGSVGSKIIITTRDERVELPMQKNFYVHNLRSLETEDMWSLLARHAFVGGDYQQHPNLEMIGKKIAKKGGGLPLTAVELGGILRLNLSQKYWSDVLNSSIWELTNDMVQPVLLLRYQYLPGPLKRCFAYCSIFPKNSIFDKKMLVQLWIAEGFIPYPKSDKTWEKLGEEYFDELVSWSLIRQCSKDNDGRNFEMHDLTEDLALAVSFPHYIRLEKYKPDNRVRHLSYNRAENNKFDELNELKGLRSFLAMPLQESLVSNFYSMPEKLLFDLLSTKNHLHVLSLSHYQNITKLPNSIGNLIYLRYLNLSGTRIKRLSSEICKLYNLQTLLLSKCFELTELPRDMGKLVNLRHLDIRGTKLKEMPVQISTLENLQTLSDFIVSVMDVGLKIGDLGKYPHLRGNLSISQLENVTDPSHAFDANLMFKKEIDELELRWSYTADSNSHIQSHVLERLRPPTNLKGLIISGYGGDKSPNWLGDSLFGNMVRLSISECKNCSGLPSLGKLSNLKELFISKMQSVKSVDIEFYGSGSPSFQPFPSLKTMHFDHMDEWEEWKLIEGSSPQFPNLIHLSLGYCPKLKRNIPCDLPKLTYLSVKHCPELRGMTPYNLPSLIGLELTECPLLIETSPLFDVFSQLLSCLNYLQKLTLKNIPFLTSFPKDGLPKTLQSLHIEYCENLEFLSHESFHNCSSLEHLTISNSCNPLTSFTLCSLPVLQSLYIGSCKHLKSILIAEDVSQQNLLFLKTITIEFCNELESVSLSGFPIPNLTHLTVRQCENLYSLPKPMNRFASLHTLKIDGLPNLKPVSIDDLPLSLRVLYG